MKSLLISSSEQQKLIQNETERRRTLRLLQTRQVEKQRAAELRQTIAHEKKKQTYLLIDQLKDEWTQEKMELHDNLEYQFRENLMEMGKGHKEAADQPDYEHQWLSQTLANDARAVERGEQALEKLHSDQMQNENERNLHLLHRKAALELEKVRSQRIAALPIAEDPLRDLQLKPSTVVTVHDPSNFSTSRYHLEEHLVTKEDDQHADAAEDALLEQQRVEKFVFDKQRLWNEQQEKARVRGDNALKREVLDNAYENVLDDLAKLEREDRDRRQKEIEHLPKSIFIPPWRREEEREEKQRQMETAFEQVYQDKHRKQPIPIVLMNEEEEEVESDRTLIAEDEETENVSPEYRMATVTPSANTKQVVEELPEDDEEATMADPTLMTLAQTPLPDPQVLKEQQQKNMKRLMEKIERQRQAAQHRLTQQTLITPSHKTPQRLVVSPGYEESASSTAEERSVVQEQSISSSASSNVEIEERRLQLECRKHLLEEQIRHLSERANLSFPLGGSSLSDLSIESFLRNLRPTSQTTSVPSTSPSLMATADHPDGHDQQEEEFLQAVQAIVTSEESQLPSSSSSSSGIAVGDDIDRSGSDLDHRGQRFQFDRYESHSSEDRDHSLEDLIARLLATQQQQSSLHPSETLPRYPNPLVQESRASTLIDDLVDDAVSSPSMNSSRDRHSPSSDLKDHFILFNHPPGVNEDEKDFYEEKRLIEEELELIRREREHLLQEHHTSRQQPTTTALIKPPPSLLRSRINVNVPTRTDEVHELSTIQEVDTPVSSRNTSIFHHRSPLKSSLDLQQQQQQLERISSADSSASSLSDQQLLVTSSRPLLQQQQVTNPAGLERDDSGISLIDGPRSSATSRTTLAGGAVAGGTVRSSSSGIQSLLFNVRQPRVRTITNETTTTNTSTSANQPVVVTTPRSNTESDDQSISSVSKKWREILANECLPQLPLVDLVDRNDQQAVLTHSLGFRSTTNEDPSKDRLENVPSSALTLPSEEQFLRSQYDNEQCDLMSLIKVHEYLTKQQRPSSASSPSTTLAPAASSIPALGAVSSSSTTPTTLHHPHSHHHQSYSTLTSVTYRSSLAKQAISTGPPISTASHTSFSSSSSASEMPPHLLRPSSEPNRRDSLVSDIHHLTRSPNTFETSMTSNNSSSRSALPVHDTLSYLIEQNQRAMQRLISDDPLPSTTFFSSASMRAPDYESGTLIGTTLNTEAVQQKSSFIETGSLSTVDFPSALLAADEQQRDRGILDEPSITLLSNSYRSLSSTTGQQPTVAAGQSNSQQHQKKKQCSSPLSTCGDKTSACSTPSLSPIKNESLLHLDGKEVSSPLFLAMPAISGHSPRVLPSSTHSSLQHSSQQQLMRRSNDDDSSLSSFERHELSAGNGTLMTTNEHDEIKGLEVPSPNRGTSDWSYYVTVGEGLDKALGAVAPLASSSSSSSGTSHLDLPDQRHVGGLEFFVDGKQAKSSTIVQLPTLQSALQSRRADFLATSQKRVSDIKEKDYSSVSTAAVSIPSRLKAPKSIPRSSVASSSASMPVVETDSEERQRRARESKERSKRLYDQLAEVQEKKKVSESKQQAQAYRARMAAFQTALDKKKGGAAKKPSS